MPKIQSKKYFTPVIQKSRQTGDPVRAGYVQTITEKAPVIPKPATYSDIDNSFFEYIKKEMHIVSEDGDVFPTYTTYSGQRYSERNQTWEHTDSEDNLTMNFILIDREINPSNGTGQGDFRNIPGEPWFRVLTRTVLDDNGTESYEVYYIRQPFDVDFTYRVTVITNLMEHINDFNMYIANMFKSIDAYIRPNGYYMSMVLEDIADESVYSIEDRQHYSQTASIRVRGRILREEDIKKERVPKRYMLFMEGDQGKRPKVSATDIDVSVNPETQYRNADITIELAEWHTKVNFDFDTDMKVEKVETDNIRSLRIFINNEPIFYDKGFQITQNDNIRIFIKALNPQEKSKIKFIGYYPGEYIEEFTDMTPENVSDTPDELVDDHVIIE